MNLPIVRPNVNRYTEELMPIMKEIFDSNMLTNVYNYSRKFEKAVEEYTGVKNAVAVSSGTSGLILLLEALGIREKEVIIPSFTFVATAAAAYWTNNRIIFGDIDSTFTLDPKDLEDKINKRTGIVLAVHMYGNPAHIKELREIAEDHNIPLIFDAAHAFGSEYFEKKLGNFGNAEVFSLSPTKLLTSVEGGIITTNNDELAKKLRVMRNYGMFPDYTSKWPGLNARMSEVHAAVGLVQMKDMDTFVSNRLKYVSIYKEHLSKVKGIKFQEIPPGHKSSHKDFSVVVNPDEFTMTRDELGKSLEESGVGVKKYFYPPIHRLKAYEDKEAKLPMTDYVSDNILSLPIYNFMEKDEIMHIINIIRQSR